MNIEEREARLKAHVAAKTIARGTWTDVDDDGRSTACLLAAWSPEAVAGMSATVCPAGAMPEWLAQCTIDIDDEGSESLWWPRVERYAAVIRRVVELPPKRLKRLDYEFRAVALREARKYAGTAVDVVNRSLALCERAAAGKRVTEAEWKAARAAARAAWATARAAAWAARAEAASASAGWAARSAAAWSAEEAAWARAEADAAARAAAWDRILDGWLAAMEGAV